jgi:hypothetical protein
MMTKVDAIYYYNVSSSFFIDPKTIIPLKDKRLLVAD